jgi:hypothetical protein
MYPYIYMYMYIYVHIYIYICMHINMYMNLAVDTSVPEPVTPELLNPEEVEVVEVIPPPSAKKISRQGSVEGKKRGSVDKGSADGKRGSVDKSKVIFICLHIYMNTYVYTCRFTQKDLCMLFIHVDLHTWTCVCIHIYILKYVLITVYIYRGRNHLRDLTVQTRGI